MNIPMINLKEQFRHVKKDILKNINEVLSEQKLILGKYCGLLEKTIADYVGVKYAITCANGTDALILSLMALGLKHGDEVITTPYTFFATASSVALVGARPVFVDVKKDDLNIDPQLIARAITDKTKAIIVVHLFGKLCDMDEIVKIGEKYGIPVIEDMAQSLGAQYRGKKAGSFGDIAALSFYPTKNLGGIGEGGMVLTDREDLGEKVKKLRVHGMGVNTYHHEIIGINSRLDEIKAAAIFAKFPYLEEWNRKRWENARFYNEKLKDLPVILPPIPDDGSHIFHHYVIRTQDREGLQTFLKESGIQTGIYYPIPLHLQRCFNYLGYREGLLPVSEDAAKTSLALPVYPELKKTEKEYIVKKIKEFFALKWKTG
ncbi:MAG TPA: DegT/DnrJ/EryC1/StrS family aminotransferase [Syntrophorhabdaceae bacterium]|nr:DegT/DnrJ/EryC1/StrS family aminotransferase [Syntrophorhabdaceae bacterium]